jgi:hypothetical protein
MMAEFLTQSRKDAKAQRVFSFLASLRLRVFALRGPWNPGLPWFNTFWLRLATLGHPWFISLWSRLFRAAPFEPYGGKSTQVPLHE